MKIIGISKYDPYDIRKMEKLWNDKFKYRDMTIINQGIGSYYISKSKLNSVLNDIAARVQLNKSVDGLIIIYSGH